MTKIFIGARSSFLQATRSRARPILLNSSRYVRTPSSAQQSIRTYTSSGIFRQEKRSLQETATENDVSEETTQDIAVAEEESATSPTKNEGPKIWKDNSSRFYKWMGEMSKEIQTGERWPEPLPFAHGVTLYSVNLQRSGKVAICVCFENPAVANCLDKRLMKGLIRAFQSLACHPGVSVVFLTSESFTSPGNTFCSGAHLQQLSVLRDRSEAETFIREVSNLCTAIRETPVPVVALISGACIGAGLEMAASCDVRVAVKNASFSMPEVHLQIPSVVQARLLCDIVGWGRARHLMLTGESWTAQQGYEAGLVTKVFDDKFQMKHWASVYASQIERSTTDVYSAQKQLMKKWENQSVDEGIEAGVNCFADAYSRPENVEEIQKAIRTVLSHKRHEKNSFKQKTSGDKTDDKEKVGD